METVTCESLFPRYIRSYTKQFRLPGVGSTEKGSARASLTPPVALCWPSAARWLNSGSEMPSEAYPAHIMDVEASPTLHRFAVGSQLNMLPTPGRRTFVHRSFLLTQQHHNLSSVYTNMLGFDTD